MVQRILSDTEVLLNEVDQLLVDFSTSEINYEDTMAVYSNMSRLLETIKRDGVCRNDIKILNDLEFTNLEEKFYSEARTFIGANEVALEIESKLDFRELGIGVLLAALVALLGWIVTKLIGKLFSVSNSASGASGSAQASTPVNITEDNGVATVEVDANNGNGNGNGGNGNGNGGNGKGKGKGPNKSATIYFSIPEQFRTPAYWLKFQKSITDAVDSSTNIDLDDLVKDVVKFVAAFANSNPNYDRKELIKAILAYAKPDSAVVNYVNTYYKDIHSLIGSKVDASKIGENLPEYDKRSMWFGLIGSVSNESFDDKYSNVKSLTIPLDSGEVELCISDANKAEFIELEKVAEKAKKRAEYAYDNTLISSGSESLDNAITLGIKQTLNKQITFPLKAAIGGIRVAVAVAILSSQGKGYQTKLHIASGKVLSGSEIKKIKTLINKAYADDTVARDVLIKEANSLGVVGKSNKKKLNVEDSLEVFSKLTKALHSKSVPEKDLLGIMYYAKCGSKALSRLNKDEFYSLIEQVHVD